jgi:hypothetical protein
MAQSILGPLFPHRKALDAALGADAPAVRSAWSAALPLRAALLVGCALAIGMAGWLGDPSGYLQADPALARLLRGMALIKGMIVIGAVAAVYWRLAWPARPVAAASYLAASWVLAGSAMLIWQLSYIVLAAVLFHAAALSLLIVGWRER